MKVSKAGIAAGVLVIILVALVVFFALPKTQAGVSDSFAQCLTTAGAKMYGAYWCPHCNSQKAMFGASWQYVDYIECATPGTNEQNAVCAQAGITGYPTWVFADNSRIAGEATFAELSAKTGCSPA